MKKLVFGVGVNDVKKCEENIRHLWKNMLTRCYCQKYQERQPTYIGCYVCSEWLTLSNFRTWFLQSNYKHGMELDKDILDKNNKEYGPDKCSFVGRRANALIVDSVSQRGLYPLGVHLNKRVNRFVAALKVNGRKKHIGYFSTPEEAHEAYKIEKLAYMKVVAEEELAAGNITQAVYQALINWEV